MTDSPSKPRKRYTAADAARQARLRERRKAHGWKRVTLWLNPQEAAQVEVLGDAWLGRAVKGLLCRCMDQTRKAPNKKTDKPKGQPPKVGTVPRKPKRNGPLPDTEHMPEVDALLAQGLSGMAIARRFNEQGRRTRKGAEFVGQNLLRTWRKWKQQKGGNG